jgi:toxin CcdB
MARFDVHRLPEGTLVLDIQADLLSDFRTRVVVPLLPVSMTPRSLERLHPVFEIDGQDHVMASHLAGAVPSAELDPPMTSLADQHEAIMAAIDMLVTGY